MLFLADGRYIPGNCLVNDETPIADGSTLLLIWWKEKRKLQVQVGHLLVERGPKISHEDQFQILCKRRIVVQIEQNNFKAGAAHAASALPIK